LAAQDRIDASSIPKEVRARASSARTRLSDLEDGFTGEPGVRTARLKVNPSGSRDRQRPISSDRLAGNIQTLRLVYQAARADFGSLGDGGEQRRSHRPEAGASSRAAARRGADRELTQGKTGPADDRLLDSRPQRDEPPAAAPRRLNRGARSRIPRSPWRRAAARRMRRRHSSRSTRLQTPLRLVRQAYANYEDAKRQAFRPHPAPRRPRIAKKYLQPPPRLSFLDSSRGQHRPDEGSRESTSTAAATSSRPTRPVCIRQAITRSTPTRRHHPHPRCHMIETMITRATSTNKLIQGQGARADPSIEEFSEAGAGVGGRKPAGG